MTLLLVVAVPLVFGVLCLVLPTSPLRLAAMVAGALAHLVVVLQSWPASDTPAPGDLVGLDPLGHLFLTIISVLFAATSVYFVGYHRKRLVSQRVFLACVLALLAALSLLCTSQHLGLLWVALESASLATTPLIYFRLGARALEATWKFLLMNSVGVALALLGIFCVAIATTKHEGVIVLTVADLARRAADLDPTWLRVGFLLGLVGFGTKMGLAPLHSWKPDAYGEAPPPVAALMAGGVTLGAFAGILRMFQVCAAAGLGAFAGAWLIGFGLLSIATAAVFVVGNNDYRRLLAYTSVEHMGVLVVGIGLGATGSYASMLHAMHNMLNKGATFFLAGFLWRLYESNEISTVRGTLIRSPLAGVLLLAALCATCGLPPFGMFFSELGIVLAAAGSGRWWVLAVFVLTLAVVFVGVMTAMLPMVFGDPPENASPSEIEQPSQRWRRAAMLGAAGVLLVLGFGLGAYQPTPVRDALVRAADAIHRPHVDVVAVSRVQSEVRP
ncbi:Na(+)/H(+) antiporter subunit D1 [Phycisphaerae bacterium RAS1]|nr:Na(+)/H(+) antiporter subunit D1 [Phycisphaerae bacterium RAS1]